MNKGILRQGKKGTVCDDEEKQEGGDGQRNKRRGKKGATAQPKGIGSIAVAYEGNMYALYIYQ